MKKSFIIFFILLLLCGCSFNNHNWKNISHRGQHEKYPENTLLAIEEAIKDNSNGIEIDVRQTKDGVIVLAHDKTIYGYIDGKEVNLKVAKTKYKKLKKVVLAKDSNNNDIHIPTLESVLNMAKENNLELVIHCKIQDKEFLKKVANMVVNHGMSGKCMYNVVKNYDENIKIILSIDKKATFHIPYTPDLTKNTYDKYNLSSKKQIAITIHLEGLTKEASDRIKKSGYTYYLCGVEDRNYKEVMFIKPDYIEYRDNIKISNLDIDLFRKVLKNNH